MLRGLDASLTRQPAGRLRSTSTEPASPSALALKTTDTTVLDDAGDDADLVDGDDVWVDQAGHRLGLAEEHRLPVRRVVALARVGSLIATLRSISLERGD